MKNLKKAIITIILLLVGSGGGYIAYDKLGSDFTIPIFNTYGTNPPNQGTEWLTSDFGGAGSVSSTISIYGLDSLTMKVGLTPSTTTTTAQFVIQYSDDTNYVSNSLISGWVYENLTATSSLGYTTTTYKFGEPANRLVRNLTIEGTSLTMTNATTTVSNILIDGTYKWARILWRYSGCSGGHRGCGGRIFVKYYGRESIVR